MGEPVIIDAVRSPFTKRGGCLRKQRPDTLLAAVLNKLVERAGIASTQIEDVIAGCVSQAGEQSANVARLATLLSIMPPETPALSLNRMCGSGQSAVHIAAQEVAAGDSRYAIGGGVESMSRVPMFLDVTLGAPFKDWSDLNPALTQRYDLVHQGESAERLSERWRISRAKLDAYALESHRRAHAGLRAKRHSEVVAASGTLAWAREFEPDMAKVNPWGGAIAHGHPLGATGAGLLAKTLVGLEAIGGTFGLVVFCVGHGMSTATLIERI